MWCPHCWVVLHCGLGQGLLPYQVASSSIQPFGHNRREPKIGGCAPFRGELQPHLTQRHLGRGLPPYQVASWSTIRLATIKIGQKLGALALFWFWGGSRVPHLAQCGLDQAPPSCQVSSWSIQPFGHNRHEPNIGEGALSPFWGWGAGSPSNTMSSGPRPTSVPSGILIHAAV